MIRKEDLQAFQAGSNNMTLDCVVVDLVTGALSEPITIQQLIDVCPFDEVTDMDESTVLSDLIVELLPEWKVKDIGKVFTCIKRPLIGWK